jgi:hypothetical protein
MKNRRDSDRSVSYAKAVFLFFDIIGYVRDLSPSGLRVEVLPDSLPRIGEEIHTTIISHPDLKLEPFNILTELRWTRENGPTVSVGLQIIHFSSEHGKQIYRELVEVFRRLHDQGENEA